MSGIPAVQCAASMRIRRAPFRAAKPCTYGEVAKPVCGASGAAHSVGQAIGRNPFTVIVPCHRVLAGTGEADGTCMNGGVISKRRLLSLEGALTRSGPTLFDVLLSVAPPRLQG